MAHPIDPTAFATALAVDRASPRTNLFLMATIVIGVTIRPVRIRNLSVNGALIETDALPGIGTALTLRRGSLAVDAVLMWADEHRGGISFETPITLPDWLPSGPGASRGQARVDRILSKTRDQLAARGAAVVPVGEQQLRDHASGALAEAAASLDRLRENWTGERPGEDDLRALDAATHSIRRIEQLLATESREQVDQAIRLEDLRVRLERRGRQA